MKFHVAVQLISSFSLQNRGALITSLLPLHDNAIQLINFSDFLNRRLIFCHSYDLNQITVYLHCVLPSSAAAGY